MAGDTDTLSLQHLENDDISKRDKVIAEVSSRLSLVQVKKKNITVKYVYTQAHGGSTQHEGSTQKEYYLLTKSKPEKEEKQNWDRKIEFEISNTLLSRLMLGDGASNGFIDSDGNYYSVFIPGFKTFSEVPEDELHELSKQDSFVISSAGPMVAAFVTADEDFNRCNFGYVHDGKGIICKKIDHERACFPVINKAFGTRWELLWWNYKLKENFPITKRDIESFPHLQDTKAAFNPGLEPRLLSSRQNSYTKGQYKHFISLAENEVFKQAAYESFLHVLLIPSSFFEKAFEFVSDEATKNELRYYFKERIERLKSVLCLQVPGFISFVLRKFKNDQDKTSKISNVKTILTTGLMEHKEVVEETTLDGKLIYVRDRDIRIYNSFKSLLEDSRKVDGDISEKLEDIISLCRRVEIKSNELIEYIDNEVLKEFIKEHHLVVQVYEEIEKNGKLITVPKISLSDIQKFNDELNSILGTPEFFTAKTIRKLVNDRLGMGMTKTQSEELVDKLLWTEVCCPSPTSEPNPHPFNWSDFTGRLESITERKKRFGDITFITSKDSRDSCIHFKCNTSEELNNQCDVRLSSSDSKLFKSPAESEVTYSPRDNKFRLNCMLGTSQYNFGCLVVLAYSMNKKELDFSRLPVYLRGIAYQQIKAANKLLNESLSEDKRFDIKISGFECSKRNQLAPA